MSVKKKTETRGRPPFNPEFKGVEPGPSKAFKEELGANIRRRRKKLQLSQYQLGEPLVTAATVSGIEQGKILPSLRTLRQLARNLQVQVRVLIPKSDPRLFE